MSDIDENENISNNEIIDSTSIIKESNAVSPLNNANSNTQFTELDSDINTNTSTENDGFEFGRDISYGDSQSTLENNKSDSVPKSPLQVETEVQQIEESTTNKEKESMNSEVVEKSDLPNSVPLSDPQIETEVQQIEIVNKEPITDKGKKTINPEVKAKVVKKFDQPNSFGSICDVCTKTVYPMERLMLDSKCYHKSCLKCCECGKTLNPTVVSKFNNQIFCKPDYIKKFRLRGRYDDISASSGDKQVKGSEAISDRANVDNIPSAKKPDFEHIKRENVNRDANKNIDGHSKDGDHIVANDGESTYRVADATKAWSEGRVNNDWKNSNSNNSNQDADTNSTEGSVDANAKVKNLTLMFETN